MTLLVSTLDNRFDNRIDALPIFEGTELFHIYDVFDESYIRTVIERKNRPAAILSDHLLFLDPSHAHGIDFYGLPLWTMRTCRLWSKHEFDDSEDLRSDYVFNFIVNKKQCSRYLVIKLVEIGGYSSFQYTWSGIGRYFDMTHVIEELDKLEPDNVLAKDQFRSAILSPIQMPDRFIEATSSRRDGSDMLKPDEMSARFYGNLKNTWDEFLGMLFTRSCVSLITETGNYDRLAVITEKTLYAFFGLTFPLWVGNYGQAQAIEQIGFDVFHDVIDHGYQWYPTLIERCYWALELNRRILGDLDQAKYLREQNHARLLCNRRFLLEGGLADYCDRQIEQMPSSYQSAANLVKTFFTK